MALLGQNTGSGNTCPVNYEVNALLLLLLTQHFSLPTPTVLLRRLRLGLLSHQGWGFQQQHLF
jgi:hypothetical protein